MNESLQRLSKSFQIWYSLPGSFSGSRYTHRNRSPWADLSFVLQYL